MFVFSLIACGGGSDEEEVEEQDFFEKHGGKFFSANGDDSILNPYNGWYISERRRDVNNFFYDDGSDDCRDFWVEQMSNNYIIKEITSDYVILGNDSRSKKYEVRSNNRFYFNENYPTAQTISSQSLEAGDFPGGCGNNLFGE